MLKVLQCGCFGGKVWAVSGWGQKVLFVKSGFDCEGGHTHTHTHANYHGDTTSSLQPKRDKTMP